MDDTIKFEIEIPSDNEGFVLLKCEFCGGLFKLKPEDFESESIFNIYCPNCGLTCEDYITEDVLELSQKIIENKVEEMLMKKLKEMEKSSKGLLRLLRMGLKKSMNNLLCLVLIQCKRNFINVVKKKQK